MRGKNRSYSVETEQGEFTIKSITKDEIPVELEYIEPYPSVYEVLSPNGTVVFWLAKGKQDYPNEVVGWYRNTGSMYMGYGLTFAEIVNDLLRDGWKYA